MRLEIPNPSLVLLIGISGAGKSTFARRHFANSQVVSSDHLRAVVSDYEDDQSATPDAFEILHLIVSKRLRRRRLTVVDATNVQETARRPLLALARAYRVPVVAIVLRVAVAECMARNRERPYRVFGDEVLYRKQRDLEESLDSLWLEGFHAIHVLCSISEIDNAEISFITTPVQNDRCVRGSSDT